jgi:hypothetical protein
MGQIGDPTEENDYCYEDAASGKWVHHWECPAAEDRDGICPFKFCQRCTRKLDGLKLLILPTLCFQDPRKAVDQKTLEGMAQDSCIYEVS